MSVTLMAIIFFGITLGLVAIPFVPCLREWRKRTDSEPLHVIRGAEVDIRHFEKGFRAYLEANLTDKIKSCRSTAQPIEGVLDDETGYLVVPDKNWPINTDNKNKARSADRMIISCGDLDLPPETTYPVEIYSGGSFKGGDKNIYRAILAEDRIRLGNDSISLRWLHAGEVVKASPGSVLYGRVSAGSAILLTDGCHFERLHAPLLEFGKAPEWPDQLEPKPVDRQVMKARDIPHLVENEAKRWLIDKKLEIPEERMVETNLVVTGWAKLGDRSRLVGSIKTRHDLHLGKGVEVEGSVVSEKNIYIGEGCRIKGPVLAEGNVYIERRTVIGSTETPTTISAENIYITSGATSYGTVWAHGSGRVYKWDEMSKLLKQSEQT
jgi:cytoskeletal protein CcmA (bactofilin family)